VAIAAALLVVLLIAVPAAADWRWPKWTGLQGKTVWDLAQLVVVPITLAIVAHAFSNRQRVVDREIARDQRAQDQALADERRRADADLALDRAQEDALQAYLSSMTALLLDHDPTDTKVAVLAQARTLTLLPRLDGTRKASVMRFLASAKLISSPSPIVVLNGADLSGMQAGPITLDQVSLGGANLSGCDCTGATISNSNFGGADLSGAKLSDSSLHGSNFCAARLAGTNFSRSVLIDANFAEGMPTRPSMSLDWIRVNRQRAAENWLRMLAEARFERAKYDYSTKWPPGFDPVRAGAIDVSD
jgi:uncharacterized protein YjbI with pentapeptide repeats